jgi:hypothetical protein
MAGRRPVLSLAAAALVAAASLPLAAEPSQAATPSLAFDHRTGNEWWVEVVLSGPSASSVTSAQAMDTGGAWVTLAKKSWGAWAASFHIEPGHLVKFRASVSGGWVESCWFTHPAGVEQCGGGTTTTTSPGPGGFDASFSNVKGNNWWVEAKVAANQPLAGVDARVNCGTTWRALTLREWGAWAASFNVPTGAKVDFRARSSSGAADLSQGYVWPEATLTTSCSTEPTPFDATFSSVKGNEWWVQAAVSAAGGTLSKVDVRVDRSGWKPLAKQSWGGWAAAYHLTPGATLQLRATSTTGAVDLSGCYLWTLAQPTACAADWPREGTFYRYESRWATYDLDRGVAEEATAQVYTVYSGGDWRSTCTEHYLRFEGSLDEPAVNRTSVGHGHMAPPLAFDVPEGGEAMMPLPRGCGTDTVPVQREADGYHAIAAGGRVMTLAVNDFRGTSETYNGEDADVRSDRQQGVLLSWSYSFVDFVCECYSEGFMGRVVDTNVPLGPQLSREQQRALQPAWPVAGSVAVYTADSEDGSGWLNQTYVQLDFDGSAWHGACDRFDHAPSGHPAHGGPLHRQVDVSFAPPKGAPMAAQGSLAGVTLLRECRTVAETMRVLAPEVHETFALSSWDQFQLSSIEAVRGDEDPDGVHDEDAWWDPETGMLLEWHWDHGANQFSGRLLHTDAPLR